MGSDRNPLNGNYSNGSDVERDNAYYDRMTQQALQRGGPGLSDSATDAEVMAYRMREAGFDGDMVPTGGAMPAGPGLTVKPRPLAFRPLPQLNEETGLVGFDQGKGVWSYPAPERPAIETRPLGAAAGSLSLPPVENLYTPLEGFFQGRYRMALEGLNNPNASALDLVVNTVAGAGALPFALLEAPVTGFYNSFNDAGRMAQNFARAQLTTDSDERVEAVLEAVSDGANAFLGLGGPAALVPLRPTSAPRSLTRSQAVADDMLADSEVLTNRASGSNELRPVPRVDVSDDFVKVPRSDDGFTFEYGDPTSHGLHASINKNGVLSFDVRANSKLAPTQGSGIDMSASLMNRLAAEGIEVKQFDAVWQKGSKEVSANYAYYNRMRHSVGDVAAARGTWTGKFLANYGFDVVTPPTLVNLPVKTYLASFVKVRP